MPASGETIDVDLAMMAHQLQLSAQLLQSIVLHGPPDQKQSDARHRPLKVAWIDGNVEGFNGPVSPSLIFHG